MFDDIALDDFLYGITDELPPLVAPDPTNFKFPIAKPEGFEND